MSGQRKLSTWAKVIHRWAAKVMHRWAGGKVIHRLCRVTPARKLSTGYATRCAQVQPGAGQVTRPGASWLRWCWRVSGCDQVSGQVQGRLRRPGASQVQARCGRVMRAGATRCGCRLRTGYAGATRCRAGAGYAGERVQVRPGAGGRVRAGAARLCGCG